jgi:hypothetical protein
VSSLAPQAPSRTPSRAVAQLRALRDELPRTPKAVLVLVLSLGLGMSVAVLTHAASTLGQGPRLELGYLMVAWVAVAALSVAVLRMLPKRLAAALVVLVTVAVSVTALLGSERWTWSTDQYRYRWDGIVSASGTNPYRYDESAPELAHLRTPWLWPGPAQCEEIWKDPGCTRIGHEGSHTVYPPVAQAYFLAVTELPGPAEEDRFKLWAGGLSSVFTAALVLVLLKRGRHPALAAAYAWGPLHGLEAALDGHVDVLGVGLALSGALLVMSSRGSPLRLGRWSLSPHLVEVLGGVLVGLGVGVKFYPGVVLLALAPRRYWRTWVSAGATTLLAYLPFLVSDPASVLGYLPTYVSTEGYGSGERYLVLSGLGITGTTATVLVLAVLAVLAVLVMRSRVSLLTFLGVFFLLLTPVQTWYTIILVALAAARGRLEWLVLVAAAYPVYSNPFDDRPLTGALTYGASALFVLGVTAVRHWRAHRTGVRAVSATAKPTGTLTR